MPVEKEELLSAFRRFDSDGNGSISQQEFVALMTRGGKGCQPVSAARAAAMFARFDANSDGRVDFDEFARAWCEPVVPALTETETMYKDIETIWAELTTRPGLEVPPVKLLKSKWLSERSRKIRAAGSAEERRKLALPRRQDLERTEPEAFYTYEEVKALKRGSENAGQPMRVIAISHCWETAEHPDPEGANLIQFVDAMEHATKIAATNGQHTWQRLPDNMAVFFDYCSLFQKSPDGTPRSPMENAAFKAALSRMQVWYAHQLTTCFFLTQQPEGSTTLPYMERGWPTFEYNVSMLAKTVTSSGWPQLFDISLGVDRIFQRPPPLSTAALRELLNNKHFTNGADKDLVAALYEKTAMTTVQGAARITFSSIGWGPAQIAQFTEQWLPLTKNLEAISFTSNPIGAEGAKLICDALRCGHCPKVIFLNMFNNQLGDEGADHLIEFLHFRNKHNTESGGVLVAPLLTTLRTGRNQISTSKTLELEEVCRSYKIKLE